MIKSGIQFLPSNFQEQKMSLQLVQDFKATQMVITLLEPPI